jgi:hypothetical protein
MPPRTFLHAGAIPSASRRYLSTARRTTVHHRPTTPLMLSPPSPPKVAAAVPHDADSFGTRCCSMLPIMVRTRSPNPHRHPPIKTPLLSCPFTSRHPPATQITHISPYSSANLFQ